MNELENAMTVREFSRRTGFPEQTTRRWIRSKKLVTIKVGGRYLITQNAVNDFVDRCRTA